MFIINSLIKTLLLRLSSLIMGKKKKGRELFPGKVEIMMAEMPKKLVRLKLYPSLMIKLLRLKRKL